MRGGAPEGGARGPAGDGGRLPLLEAEGVEKVYRSRRRRPVRALERLDLAVEAGESLGVVGASGAGKTTAARVLSGLERPSAGRVRYRGREVAGLRGGRARRFRRRVQLLFQDPQGSLNPRLRVGRAIREPLEAHGIAGGRAADRRVAELLSQVDLPPSLRSRYPHELSGGQRQRVALARALAVEPDVLIADEPVTGLDVSVQAQVLALLADLRRRLGLTLVLIAHDLAVVASACERIAVVHGGRVVERGPAARLVRRPATPQARRLVEAVPRLPRTDREGPRPGENRP